MPGGERVSMTAVPAARTLKLVFMSMPWSSLPSQSAVSDCSFLKAAGEYLPAHNGAAMDAARRTSSKSWRRVTDASWKRTARDATPQSYGAPRSKGFDAGTAGMEAGAQRPIHRAEVERACAKKKEPA